MNIEWNIECNIACSQHYIKCNIECCVEFCITCYRFSAAQQVITPCAHAQQEVGRGVYIYISLHFFWNQSFISQNTEASGIA